MDGPLSSFFLSFSPSPSGPVGSLWGGGRGSQGTSGVHPRVFYVDMVLAAGLYDNAACCWEHRAQQSLFPTGYQNQFMSYFSFALAGVIVPLERFSDACPGLSVVARHRLINLRTPR